jgi:hypothetical protein
METYHPEVKKGARMVALPEPVWLAPVERKDRLVRYKPPRNRDFTLSSRLPKLMEAFRTSCGTSCAWPLLNENMFEVPTQVELILSKFVS